MFSEQRKDGSLVHSNVFDEIICGQPWLPKWDCSQSQISRILVITTKTIARVIAFDPRTHGTRSYRTTYSELTKFKGAKSP